MRWSLENKESKRLKSEIRQLFDFTFDLVALWNPIQLQKPQYSFSFYSYTCMLQISDSDDQNSFSCSQRALVITYKHTYQIYHIAWYMDQGWDKGHKAVKENTENRDSKRETFSVHSWTCWKESNSFNFSKVMDIAFDFRWSNLLRLASH